MDGLSEHVIDGANKTLQRTAKSLPLSLFVGQVAFGIHSSVSDRGTTMPLISPDLSADYSPRIATNRLRSAAHP
jgi:hypothetical protein